MPDPNVRREKMAEIEQLMQDDGPIVQTYWKKLFTFYDNRVVGFGMHPTYSVFCHALEIRQACRGHSPGDMISIILRSMAQFMVTPLFAPFLLFAVKDLPPGQV